MKILLPATKIAITSLLLVSAINGFAEMPASAGSQSAQAQTSEPPSRGTNKGLVQARYGEPKDWSDPVGSPPITRWYYDQFTVYFEYDVVIHSVSQRPIPEKK